MLLNLFMSVALFFTALPTINPQSSFAIPSSEKPVKWIIEKSSTLRIDGKSNVNSFSCDIEGYNRKDNIITGSYSISQPVTLSGSLTLEIIQFNCHRSLITSDFRKTLKADKHSEMVIRFLKIESMPELKEKSELIKGLVEVEVAGVTKEIEINYSFSKTDSDLVQLNGEKNFSFSDFNLKPPRKLAGLVRIKDDFKVSFKLMLREVK
ncbi:YceI family protein [Segetibacter sp.]|jgi:hypothetical protein|uniref:YceI family protein n=1 Tax=Segetibacter sp. TaxID=2231182 RepID=UPI002626ACA8|nr:YceI family protein [Segetibacter sp.]MCW3080538.1 hypothetical protein [Segetibacter sp.]